MTALKTTVVALCLAGLTVAACAQTPAPKQADSAQEAAAKRVEPAEAKNHIGENAIVCGKVVDIKVARNGLAGRGLPASYYLDAPASSPVFYFMDFVPGPEAADQKRPDYNGKRMCATGQISRSPAGVPFILALKHSQVKAEESAK